MARRGKKTNTVYHPPYGCLTARLLANSKFNKRGCLIWQGHKSKDGYGRIGFRTPNGPRNRAAHLVAAEWWGDRIRHDEGVEYSHVCGCAACIAPTHRVWETHQENMARLYEAVPF